MDTILKCFNCQEAFDQNAKNPRILPCSNSMCTECIKESALPLSGYTIKCKCDQSFHRLKNLDEIYPCQMIIDYLKNTDAHTNQLDHLKDQLFKSKFSLNTAKYEASKVYEAISMDIDIRAETLISLVHEQRVHMIASLKEFHKKTDAEFDKIEESTNMKNIYLEQSYMEISKKLESSDISEFLRKTNEIQRSIDRVKSQICTFNLNKDVQNINLFGQLVDNTSIGNYNKIKNLLSYEQLTTDLRTKQNTDILRRYTICLNRTSSVNVNFSCKRTCNLELLNEAGEVIKTHEVSNNVLYYPIMSNTSDHFVLCYPSSSGTNHKTEILLFDSELNEISSTKCSNSAESIYMNTNSIVVTFAHKKHECCQIYDYSFNITGSFGQQINCDEPFYFENAPVETNSFKKKLNPVVFGLTDDKIYTYNKTHMVILSRQSGRVIQTNEKKSENSEFHLDSDGNIIEINLLAKEIFFYSADMNLQVNTRYTIDATEVTLVENSFIAFVNGKKRSLVLV